MTAYIIMHGAWSDQYPIHVTLDESKAKEYCEYMNNKEGNNEYWVQDCGYEDFEIDTTPLDMAYVYHFMYDMKRLSFDPQYTHRIYDGITTCATYKQREPSNVTESKTGMNVEDNPLYLYVTISLDRLDDMLALKTAIDMIAEYKAGMQGVL